MSAPARKTPTTNAVAPAAASSLVVQTSPGQPVFGPRGNATTRTSCSNALAITLAVVSVSCADPGESPPDAAPSGASSEFSSSVHSTQVDVETTMPEAPLSPPESWVPEFESLKLADDFVAEGTATGDIDGDGVVDLVAGPRWYKGPSFELGGTLARADVYEPSQYSPFFLTFIDDLDADGFVDVIVIGDAGGGNGTGTPNAFWLQNPGPTSLGTDWERRPLFDGLVSNESPAYANLVGDERKELVFMTNRRLGYASPGADPNQPWSFVAISAEEFSTPYVHGLGVGDIDGDGLMDVVEASGYWQQEAGGSFGRHLVNFTQGVESPVAGGAQMYVLDVDGDGDNDVVTALSGHGYGLSWFEQTASGEFAAHGILPPANSEGNVSQLHAVGMADLNGDGLLDIVTGKRYYAHQPPQDPGGTDPALLYWFELSRSTNPPEFLPRLIHADSGVGCNFTIADVDGNGRPDVFTSSKRGTFLHRQ